MVTNGFPKYHAIQKGFEDNVMLFFTKGFLSLRIVESIAFELLGWFQD